MPPVTAALITLNVAAYLVSLALPRLVVSFALWPIGGEWIFLGKAGFAPWQLVTYAFLHGSAVHLAFNMFGLYMFGSALEQVLEAPVTITGDQTTSLAIGVDGDRFVIKR